MNGQELPSNLYSVHQNDQTLTILNDGQFIVSFSDGTTSAKRAADVYSYDFEITLSAS